MANTSKICGLRPINQPFGAIRCNYYEAATGTALYMYQPVDLDANGRVVVATASNATLILGSVLGVFDGGFGPLLKDYSGYAPANPTGLNYSASDGLLKVLVADDPGQLFVIEEDTGGSALTAQEIGTACSFTYTATTGNTISGISYAVLDRSTTATTTDNTLRIIKKWDKPDNAYGDYCKWVVQINRHRLTPMTLVAGNLI
jgi:hypothetical protein